MLVKVEESSFVRDTNSMALLNFDRSAKDEYFLRSKMLNNQKKEIDNINNEIEALRTDISDIKNMLIQILADKNNGK